MISSFILLQTKLIEKGSCNRTFQASMGSVARLDSLNIRSLASGTLTLYTLFFVVVVLFVE